MGWTVHFIRNLQVPAPTAKGGRGGFGCFDIFPASEQRKRRKLKAGESFHESKNLSGTAADLNFPVAIPITGLLEAFPEVTASPKLNPITIILCPPSHQTHESDTRIFSDRFIFYRL
jgi:hypothetical protein